MSTAISPLRRLAVTMAMTGVAAFGAVAVAPAAPGRAGRQVARRGRGAAGPRAEDGGLPGADGRARGRWPDSVADKFAAQAQAVIDKAGELDCLVLPTGARF